MMESFFQVKFMARKYVRQLHAKLAEYDPQTYDQFSETLKQFRLGNIQSSVAVATVQKLLHNHPDLLRAFKPFVPSNLSAAAAVAAAVAKDSDSKACIDFLNQVRTRFADDGVYRQFLDCMNSHSRGESSVSEVSDKIIRLFGKHQDLVVLFKSFLPESCTVGRCKKKKIGPTDHDQEFSFQPPKKKRNPNPRREQRRIISRNETIDFDMEEALCEVDVKISNLMSTYKNAVKLMRRLSSGRISPVDVRLNEHFTPLNLACIRDLYRKLLDSENPGSAIPELMNILTKKRGVIEKSRVKIMDKWVKIRQSRHSQRIVH